MDYVESPEELAERPHSRAWLEAAANGDAAAFDFLWRIWNWLQAFDDLLDLDKPLRAAAAVREWALLMQMLASNPFWLHHRAQLLPLIIQLCARNIDGDAMAEGEADPVTRGQAEVVRCGDVDLVAHVAFITGGWDHMRSLDLRNYDRGGD